MSTPKHRIVLRKVGPMKWEAVAPGVTKPRTASSPHGAVRRVEKEIDKIERRKAR